VRSSDGTRIAYDRSGNGPPIILVDGALCSRAFGPMPKLAPLLAQHFTVFTYDRRGRNDSGDTAPYAVDREVEDLDALITEAGGSAFVHGISSGGVLALRAAASGSGIRKLAVYEPPFMIGDEGHRPPADHEGQLTRLVSSDRRADAVKFFMTRVVGMPPLLTLPMQLMPVWSKLKAVAHTLPYDAAVMGDYSLPTGLAAAVAVPTLVIGGAKSPAVLRRAAQALADVLPNGRHHALAGQSHNVSAPAIAPVLTEFFNAQG